VFFDGSTTVASVAFRQGLPSAGSGASRYRWWTTAAASPTASSTTSTTCSGFPTAAAAARRATDCSTGSSTAKPLLDIEQSRPGLGDLRMWGGYRLIDTPGARSAARLQLKLPTGDVDELAGSGAPTWRCGLELTDRGWLDRLGVTVTLMGGLTLPGNGDLLGVAPA
jgi:hypothetical protein